MTGDRLERVSSDTLDEALRYLAQRPSDNVYTHWLLQSQRFGRDGAHVMVWRDDDGAVRGVCTYGAQIIPSADDDRALEAFAQRISAYPDGVRMIVGRRRDVEVLWHRAAAAFPRPSAVRVSQPLYTAARTTLKHKRTAAPVALAEPWELDEIASNSAAMIAGELDGGPRYPGFDFRARTARMIEAGRWWRYRLEGRLAFMCNVGASMPAVAQIQGVWSPPDMRGHGYATRALAAICDHLLDDVPIVSLYVNAFNARALALYERVGFQRTGEFQTILLPG